MQYDKYNLNLELNQSLQEEASTIAMLNKYYMNGKPTESTLEPAFGPINMDPLTDS